MFNWKGVIGYTAATVIAALVFGLWLEASRPGVILLTLIGLVAGVFLGGTISLYFPRKPEIAATGLSAAAAALIVLLFWLSYGGTLLVSGVVVFFTLCMVSGLVSGVSYRIASSIGSGKTNGTDGNPN